MPAMSRLKQLIRAVVPYRLRLKVYHIRRYLRSFGIAQGIVALYKIAMAGNGLIALSIPQSRTPLLVRGNTSDVQTFEQIFIDNEYDVPIGISPKTIVDGGANVGYASVYFANRFPDPRIIAIEPHNANAEMLEKNTAAYPNRSSSGQAYGTRRHCSRSRIQKPRNGRSASQKQHRTVSRSRGSRLRILLNQLT
jgi:hypothetical protein